MRKIFLFGFFGVYLCCLIGCLGDPKVTGKVAFEDGTPLTVGNVCFESASMRYTGKINPDGTYRMGTVKGNEGVPRGTYRVSITDAIELTGESEAIRSLANTDITPRERPITRPLIDLKFVNPATSELTCEVNGTRTFDITVTKPPGN